MRTSTVAKARAPSRTTRKAAVAQRSPRPINWPVVAVIVLTTVVAAIPFGYGKYREFHTTGAYDGGLNVYSAQNIVEGGKIGRDVSPSARPATLLVNVVGVWFFGYREFGPKLIQMVMQLAALVLMFYTLRKFYGLFPAAAAVVMAAFFLSCPPFAKFGNVKEQFMIPCMITAACGLMLRHGGGGWWWLVVSGAAAINIYFFKPTGASVMIAMIVYVLAQPVLRQRGWRDFGGDVLGLSLGAVIGIAPLVIFYTWQGQLLNFGRGIPLVSSLIGLFQGQSGASLGQIVGGGEYIAGSRRVTDFAQQYREVMRYYYLFVAPIGLSVLAILWRVGRLIGRLTGKTDKPEKCQADRVVLLLALWWLLDMAFIWVSPRTYVEYFLPLNGSAAMLAGYAIYRCRREHVGFVGLLISCAVIELVTVQAVAGLGFSYLRLIPVALAVILWLAMKGASLRPARGVILAVISLFVLLWWVKPNIKKFQDEVSQLQQMRQSGRVPGWEELARFIRDNSAPQDKLYVWGWFPGIYMVAQRMCPTMSPAESNMHTDSPATLKRKISGLVRQLEADPPRFIVDSQKVHFPYQSHPVFDLWPRWQDRLNGVFDLRSDLTGRTGNVTFMDPAELEAFDARINQQVERYSYMILSYPQRPAGAVDEARAKELAQTERQRHEAMRPLREFVMKNYRPITPATAGMFVFERKRGGGQ